MTCPLSPFAAAQGEPSAPHDGQLQPDGKGVHFNILCVLPLSLEYSFAFRGRPQMT